MYRDASRSRLMHLSHGAATARSNAEHGLSTSKPARGVDEATDAAERTATGPNRARWNPTASSGCFGATLNNNLSTVAHAGSNRREQCDHPRSVISRGWALPPRG